MQLSDQLIETLVQKLQAFHRQNAQALKANAEVEPVLSAAMVQTFLQVFLDKAQTHQAAETLAQQALAHQVAYPILMLDINFLKQEIIKHYKGRYDNPYDLFEKIDHAFETVKNGIAHAYLMHEAAQNGIFPDARQVQQQKLLQVYDQWFSLLRQAIVNEDSETLRTLAQTNEAFKTALTYPETLMVCMDAIACKALEESHANVMRLAASVVYKVNARLFEQALLLFTELRVAVEQLAVLISTLYFNYRTNQLSVFLRALEQLPLIQPNISLTMLNIERLRQLNELQGEACGDVVIEQLQAVIERQMASHPNHIAYAPGVSGDFYLVFVDQTREQIQLHLKEIETRLSTHLQQQDKKRMQLNSVTVPLDEIQLRGRAHFRRLFEHMHQLRIPGQHQILKDGTALNQHMKAQLEQVVNIKKLMEEDALDIYLQPLVSAQTGQIAGFEVLGRLVTPEGVLSAGLFIDKLIELQLIEVFDTKILDRVAQYAEKLELITGQLFINVSPLSLESEAYVQRLRRLVKQEASSLNLVLELTEQTALKYEKDLIRLHEQEGMVFAIDDFGAGYSSLEMVVRLSDEGVIKYLKIDGSITTSAVANKTACRVLEVIKHMADSLDLLTVAEFIESQKSMALIQQLGIDFGQGYFLGKPDAVESWIAYRLFSKAG